MVADLVLIAAIFVHLIVTVAWMGGIFIYLLVLIPSVQQTLEPPAAGKLMGLMSKKARTIGYTSIVLFLASGSIMTVLNKSYEGLLIFGSLWSQVLLLKHVFVFALIVLAIYHNEVLMPKQARFPELSPEERANVEKLLKLDGLAALFLVFSILLLTAVVRSVS
ncbi:MAG: hypothetical protein MAG715_00847 [Methanonatronarchaeales archaeon]|nr:hypothetical protein [Methanonatronarchaeales archaeon]